MSFQAEGENIQRQRDVPHGGMFWKIESFMPGCDGGLSGKVARMKQNIFLESD